MLLHAAVEFLCVLFSSAEMAPFCTSLGACGEAGMQARCWGHSWDAGRGREGLGQASNTIDLKNRVCVFEIFLLRVPVSVMGLNSVMAPRRMQSEA